MSKDRLKAFSVEVFAEEFRNQEQLDGRAVDWMEKVSDEQYRRG